jgi:hypothetical protein
MEPIKRAEKLFDNAKKLGLVNPINGDGMPTVGMVHEAICDAEYKLDDELSDLRHIVRRLAKIIRKTDPENETVKDVVKFLKAHGGAGTVFRDTQ